MTPYLYSFGLALQMPSLEFPSDLRKLASTSVKTNYPGFLEPFVGRFQQSFWGGSLTAEDDPCDPNPCFSGVACAPAPGGGVRCGPCPQGYRGNGRHCRRTVTCRDRPCAPGGWGYRGGHNRTPRCVIGGVLEV